MIDLLNEIWQTICNNKLRTALTGVAVAWGIFMLIVLLGLCRGVVNQFDESMKTFGGNTITLWGGTTTKPWRGNKEGRSIELKSTDPKKILGSNRQHIAEVNAAISSKGGYISTSRDYTTTSYQGVTPQAINNEGITMAQGRFINQLDVDQARKVIVLSQKVVTSLFADPNSAVGQQVSYNGLAFTVIGVYEHRWRSTAFIPISTADMLQGKTGEVSEINATLTDVNSTDKALKVESDIRHAMAQSHEFDPDDQGAVSAWNRCENFLRMQLGGSILNIAAWVIGLFTLLSGVIGVSNIMFVSVHERTHEIGIRRAIGAKPRNILTQILLESVAITTLFGYVGIVMGTVVMEIVARLTEGSEAFSNPRVDLSITIYVTITLIICGAAAGLFPALKALKVKPVEALRDE